MVSFTPRLIYPEERVSGTDWIEGRVGRVSLRRQLQICIMFCQNCISHDTLIRYITRMSLRSVTFV